jgi:transposase
MVLPSMRHQAGGRDLIGALPSALTVLSVPRPGGVPANRMEWKGNTMMTDSLRVVYGGVDTHLDVHVAAAVDQTGRLLASKAFPTTPLGLRRLEQWMSRHGQIARVGVEGTGTYGLGLQRVLQQAGHEVIEVNRPNRQMRRSRGKSDTVDAEAAARAVLSGHATIVPKSRDGVVESMRVLRVAIQSARRQMGRITAQIRHLIVTAPEPIRVDLQALSDRKRIAKAAGYRPGDDPADVTTATKTALRTLARQWLVLAADDKELTGHLAHLVELANPALLALPGIGPDTAAALLITAGDNPERLRSSAAFAALCGVSPIEASSGKTQGRRLNRGGDRRANSALYRVVIVRMSRKEPRTTNYVARRTAEGLSKRDIIRCLKRYVAREAYQCLLNPQTQVDYRTLRSRRQALHLPMRVAAQSLGICVNGVARVERGIIQDHRLTKRYHDWLTQQGAA